MRNYFIQKQELTIAEARFETLIERKIRLKNKIKSCTQELKENSGSGSFDNDKMTNYLIRLSELDDEINELKEDIKCLNKNLAMMEQALKEIKGIKEEIFLLKYKENLKVKEIARKTNYSIARVYQYLDEINAMLQET